MNKKTNKELNRYFLACELKPYTKDLWKLIEPFAYNIKVGFVYGSLGVISYNPESYAIIDIHEEANPLMGYLMTITHPETIALLDKLKGYNGEGAFNFHTKTIIRVYTDIKSSHKAWAYVISDKVLDSYRQIEEIKHGIFDSDQKQIDLLEEIGESL